MPATVWSGSVSFGMVTIPVHLVSAVSSESVGLRMLHDKDAAPLRRRMVCPRHDKVVDPDEQVRGFEISEGKYVVVSDEELESLAPERSRSLEIEEFVRLEAIGPLYFDRPYYLEPREGGEKPYALLVRAQRDTGLAGLGKIVLWEREYLVALWPVDDVLCLSTLRFEAERVSPGDIAPRGRQVQRKDLDALVRAIKKSARRFDPAAYEDENDLRLMELVKKRAKDAGVEKAPGASRRKTISAKDLTRRINRRIRQIRSGG